MNPLKPEEIVSVLEQEIGNYEVKTDIRETGTVIQVGDGIATVYGLENAMYGEIILFDHEVRGMVQKVERKTVGCILFASDVNVKEGSQAYRTKQRAGVSVGEGILGRVVDGLGKPIDGKGPVEEEAFLPVEQEAPDIISREPVNQPLQTGILAIDAMFPIGRGQRELIIGDRQTGKTSIAIDTILNQKGQDVICIYVGIGQKASTIANLVTTLNKYGAMEYSIVVSASASDPAPLQYIAPYTGTTIGEFFMRKGKDVLIVYDDLSKHAVAYRTISLLLKRPPGREAYPGDVFYLHSRLLERSCHLSQEHGGGSMTALPIIETLAGDISAYIPTNVISITDGQIFLESNLFFAGIRPAVNVGLSVSRVGGAAQTKAMKKVSGNLRIDLAQYREMEVFTQFSSDLDPSTKELLRYGKSLIEVLKQPTCRPMKLYEQIITLCAAQNKLMVDIPARKLWEFRTGLLNHFVTEHKEICDSIMTTKVCDDDMQPEILRIAQAYKEQVKGLWQA